MAMNDPLGDMLTRIRNAQTRKRGKVTTPGCRCARRCSTCSRPRATSAATTTEFGNGRSEFEIDSSTSTTSR